MKKKTQKVKKVGKGFIGECNLNQLPDGTLFKLVKRDGRLSKKTYLKEKGSWNPFCRKYDIAPTDDVYGAGKEMKGSTRVSTNWSDCWNDYDYY